MIDSYAKIISIYKSYEKQTGIKQDRKFYSKQFLQEQIITQANHRISQFKEPLCYTLRLAADSEKRSKQKEFMSIKTTAEARVSAIVETLIADYIKTTIPTRIKDCRFCGGTGQAEQEDETQWLGFLCYECYGFGFSSCKKKIRF